MANVFRGPLLVNRRDGTPDVGVTVFQNLLLTTLAVAAAVLPPGKQAIASAPQSYQTYADTSHSVPLVLQAAIRPRFDLQHQAPINPLWQPRDSSASVPLVLQAAIKPIFNPAHILPQQVLHRLEDTSRGMPLLIRAAPVIPPFSNPEHLTPINPLWQPVNTSWSTPVTLQAAIRPFFNPVHSPQIPGLWQPADTSHSAYFPQVPPPIGKASWVQTPFGLWQPRDTSSGSYLTFYSVAAQPIPIGKASWTATPFALWQPRDTSLSAYVPQHPIIVQPLPIGKAGFVATPYKWIQPPDTSTGSYITRFPSKPSGSSGTASFVLTRDQLIASSLRLLRVLQDGQTMTADMITTGAEDLNTLITSLQAGGLQLWTYQWIPIPLQANKYIYTIGPVGADITTTRPLRLMDNGSYLRDTSSGEPIDRPLIVLSRTDYSTFSGKADPGVANSLYYQPGIDSGAVTSPSIGYGTLYVYCNPYVSGQTVVGNFQRPIYVMNTGTDEFDFPSEWLLYLRYALAVVMADQYEVPQNRLIRLVGQAEKYHKDLLDWSVELASFRFAPDQQMDWGWNS